MATPPPPKSKPKPKVIKAPKPAASGKPGSSHTPKTFKLAEWTSKGQGEKIVLYGKSGVGKTTLAAQLDNAVFIGLDDGGRKIANPITGKDITAVPGIETFQDLRDALAQDGLFPDDCTIVIDTITKAQQLIENHVVATVQKEKGGYASNLNDFGWGDGYRHVFDHSRLLLTDLDQHVAKGRNVILLAQLDQVTVANSAGTDYLEDGPKLQQNRKGSVRTEVCEWADHVFRIGYLNFDVKKEGDKKTGKVAGQDMTRAVFTGGAAHFIAKSRPIDGYRIPTVISFDSPECRDLWSFIFSGARAEEDV